MFKLNIRLLAMQDIQETLDYYDEISFKITDKFLDQLYEEFDSIISNPNSFQIKYRKTRV